MASTAPTTPIGHGLGHGANTTGMPWDPSEFTPELAWPLSISIYDKMRRQDAQTKSVLNAVTLPIRRATWRLDPNDAPDPIVTHIANDLGLTIIGQETGPARRRRRQRFDWLDHLRLALLALPYGHMAFEKVGELGNDGLWHLTRLEERLPATIAKINVARNGDLQGIEQHPSGLVGDTGLGLPIASDRLVFYSHEREGGLWQGQSILRSSYKHWLLKDRLIRADAMKHERNGMGIPVAEAPEHATDKAIERMHDVVTRWRAGEVSGAAVPPGWKIRLVGVEGTLPDTLASIRYHDEQIAQETLAMFMKLGSSATGSRALGEEFVDFFMMSLQATADEVANTFNEQLLEVWVDWNWGEDVPAPRVVVDPIGADQDITAEALKALIDSGAVSTDPALEKYIRERFRLPEPDQPAPAPAGGAAGRGRRPFPRTAHASTDSGPNPDWPGGVFLDELVAHYAPRIGETIAAMFDVEQLAVGFLDGGARLAADDQTSRRAGEYVGAQPVDTAALEELLREILGDAYIAGMRISEALLGAADVIVHEQPWDSLIDWDDWQPGHARAAAEIAGRDGGRGLARLLDEAGVTINGITDTTLDTLARKLAAALDEGWSVDQTARTLRDVLDDATRAETIAQTEMARAMTVASLDLYAEHGVTARRWLLSLGACPRCVENEHAGPVPLHETFPNGDPPVHPHCVCAIAPVVDDDYPLDPDAPAAPKVGPDGLTADQYETMRPESQWTERKRDEILTSLKSTETGRVLADTLDRFQDGGSISRLRTNIGKRLAGEDLDLTSAARADAVIGALRNAPTDMAPDVLYRGMSVKGSQKTVLGRYEVGQDLDLSLTSFTSDRKTAVRFQQMTSGSNTTSVMIELVGDDKQVLPIQNLARDRRLFGEKEWVGGGRFEVIEVKKSPSGGVILRVQQKASL